MISGADQIAKSIGNAIDEHTIFTWSNAEVYCLSSINLHRNYFNSTISVVQLTLF